MSQDKVRDLDDDKVWITCSDCDEGFVHECGEDTCCCLNPEPNIECDVCGGEGGWYGVES